MVGFLISAAFSSAALIKGDSVCVLIYLNLTLSFITGPGLALQGSFKKKN